MKKFYSYAVQQFHGSLDFSIGKNHCCLVARTAIMFLIAIENISFTVTCQGTVSIKKDLVRLIISVEFVLHYYTKVLLEFNFHGIHYFRKIMKSNAQK